MFATAASLLVSEQAPDDIPDDYDPWLHRFFPEHVRAAFADHHHQIWRWIWALELGIRPETSLVALLARGGGKSTTIELGCAAIGALEKRRYILYVCHETGTKIHDPDRGWMVVDDHPTARRRAGEVGVTVKVSGLPWTETVTKEHRYWARRVARRDVGHRVPAQIMKTPPGWIEAQHLDWNTWVGLPIDQVVEDRAPDLTKWDGRGQQAFTSRAFEDPEFWWAVGLWWGDGTLGGARNAQISWACADAHPDISARLVAVLEKHGYTPVVRPAAKGACHHVAICDSSIARWLYTWKAGRNRKQPPCWVERLPHEKQSALIRGYFDADGYVNHRGGRLVSIHLDGLLAVRRMLLRLGIVSTLAKKRAPREATIEGRTYQVAQSYSLSIEAGAERIGYTVCDPTNGVRDVFIEDGHLWSRIRDLKASEPTTFVAINTSTETYLTSFGMSHNCGKQSQADDHVANVANLLESRTIALAYPTLGKRLLNLYGSSRGWRRNRIRSEAGLTVDALGLDVAIRGVKLEEQRPDLIIFDDVDDRVDSMDTIQKKITSITTKILPAGSTDAATIFIQNLVHYEGIAARLAGVASEEADFLTDREVIGPIPAVIGLKTEPIPGTMKHRITAGTPTWVGQDIETCEYQINKYSLRAFLSEAQHKRPLPDEPAFPEFDVSVHVCKPLPIPKSWPRWRAVDYGYAVPYCCLWFTRSPSGTIYIYRERYGARKTAREQAYEIRLASAGEKISFSVGDPAMWATQREGQKFQSVASQYAEMGVHLTQASNDRLAGKERVHDVLEWAEGVPPVLQIFETCHNLVRTMPMLPADPHKLEDVDTEAEDHAYDSGRYGLMAAHWLDALRRSKPQSYSAGKRRAG